MLLVAAPNIDLGPFQRKCGIFQRAERRYGCASFRMVAPFHSTSARWKAVEFDVSSTWGSRILILQKSSDPFRTVQSAASKWGSARRARRACECMGDVHVESSGVL